MDDEEEVSLELEEESVEEENSDFKVNLFKKLRTIIRVHALSAVDDNTKLSTKNREIFTRIEHCLETRASYSRVGELALFFKY